LQIDGRRLKVEFTKFPFPRLAGLERLASGLAVDPVLEIYVNKVHAMTDRREPKDEVVFQLGASSLPALREVVRLAERKFGVPGRGYSLQRRLLAVSSEHPPTTPPVTAGELRGRFRREVERLIASSPDI
jgi:hypothetical protein